MKCMICKKPCDGKSILKEIDLRDKSGNVIEWKLCKICFNLWVNQGFDKLSKRMKK